MENLENELTLTVDRLMKELHISRPMAYQLTKEEGFPAFRIGSRILVSRDGLKKWIEEKTK